MNEATKFLIYCIEEYKVLKNMNGSQVVNLFSEKAVMPFILEFHDVLHCEGTQAIAAQIDDYILNRE